MADGACARRAAAAAAAASAAVGPRRLRHVNDDIRLKKWQARQRKLDRAEEQGLDKAAIPNEDEATESGLRGWYLGVPSWCEARAPRPTGRVGSAHLTRARTPPPIARRCGRCAGRTA